MDGNLLCASSRTKGLKEERFFSTNALKVPEGIFHEFVVGLPYFNVTPSSRLGTQRLMSRHQLLLRKQEQKIKERRFDEVERETMILFYGEMYITV